MLQISSKADLMINWPTDILRQILTHFGDSGKTKSISHVAGHSDDASIAGGFAAHFSDSNSVTSRSSVSLCDVFRADVSQNGEVFKQLFSTEEVDKVMNTLKFGKAVGIDRGVYTRGNGARCTMAKIGGEML